MMCLIVVILNKHNSAEYDVSVTIILNKHNSAEFYSVSNEHNSAQSYEMSGKHNTVNCNSFEQNNANTITCHNLTPVNSVFCPSKQCRTSKSVSVSI